MELTPEEEKIQRQQRSVELADIDLKYGLVGKYDRVQLETEVKTHLENSAKSMLEAGRKLVLLKEYEGHGNFMKSLDRIGVHERTARKMMKAAVKLADLAVANRNTLSDLSSSKIHELVLLDDDDLKELSDGGSVAGLTLEDADKMSVRELKAELKRIKHEKAEVEKKFSEQDEVHQQILSDKNKKIDDLDKELRVLTDPNSWNDKALTFFQRLHDIMPNYSRISSELMEIITAIETLEVKEWEQSQILLIEQVKFDVSTFLADAEKLTQRVNCLAPEYNAVFHELKEATLPIKKVYKI